MIQPLRSFSRAWRCESGATAVEFAIVCLPLLLLSLGIVEFGRALFVRNDLSYAADVAARKVLIDQIPATASESDASAALNSAVRGAFGGGDPSLLQVSVKTETVDGVTFRVLSIRYPFTLLLVGLSNSPIGLAVSRRIPVE